jgi:hypothetical protein
VRPACRLPSLHALLLATAVCRIAAADDIAFHEDYASALAAAKERGQLLLIVVEAPVKNADGVEVCAAFRKEVLGHSTVAPLINRSFAPLILDVPKVKAGQQKIPPVVKLQGQIRLPLFLVYTPDGELVLKHEGYVQPDQLLPKLKEAAGEVAGKGLAQAKMTEADAADALARAREAARAEDPARALAILRAVADGAPPGEAQENATRLLDLLAEKAREQVNEAERLEAEPRMGTAIRTYRQVVRQFPGTPAAQRAAERLKSLRTDRELRVRLNRFQASQLLAQAQADVDRRRYAPAVEALDTIIKRYPLTPSAKAAKELRHKLGADAEIARRIKEEKVRSEAERLLGLARNFHRSRRYEQAVARCREVIRKFPGTRFARTAERLLESVRSDAAINKEGS